MEVYFLIKLFWSYRSMWRAVALIPHGRRTSSYSSKRRKGETGLGGREVKMGGKKTREKRMRQFGGVGIVGGLSGIWWRKWMLFPREKAQLQIKPLQIFSFTERCWKLYCLRYRGIILLIYSTHILLSLLCFAWHILVPLLAWCSSNFGVHQNHLGSLVKAGKGPEHEWK